MARRIAWIVFTLAAACAGAAGSPGGPVEDQLSTEPERDQPLPGQASLSIPITTLYQELQAQEDARKSASKSQVARPALVVNVNDLDKLQEQQTPPQRFSLPADFQPVVSSSEHIAHLKKLTDLLPSSLVAILPSLPFSLPHLSLPHLPDYLPGLDFSAEVHHPATSLPHVPTPSEVLRGVTHLLDKVMHHLLRKQEQIAELINCACPRPAHCENLFQEFSSGPQPAPNESSPSSASPTTHPALSVFAEITKPHGAHGPSLGFYVDSHGPHLGRPDSSSPSSIPDPESSSSPSSPLFETLAGSSST